MKKFLIIQVLLIITFIIFFTACTQKTNEENQNLKNNSIEIIDMTQAQNDYGFELACFLYDIQFAFSESPEFGITPDEIPSLEICLPYQILSYENDKLYARNTFFYLLKIDGVIRGAVDIREQDGEFLCSYSSGVPEYISSHTEEYGVFVQISDGLDIYALSDGDVLIKLTNNPDGYGGSLFINNVPLEQLNLNFIELKKYSLDINISVPFNDYIEPYMDKITELIK